MDTRISVVSRLASLLQQRANCIATNNTLWRDRAEAEILAIVDQYLPSGSGWDNGTSIDIDRSSSERIVFTGSFHHMNDVGMYDGWTDHTITVKPSFDGISLTISGRNRNEIKDYLHELFDCALLAEMPDDKYRALCESVCARIPA